MDVIVDGASMMNAASRIDAAVRDLALICQRIEPLLKDLSNRKALSSEDIDAKYGKELAEETRQIGKNLESLQKTTSKLTTYYIDQVDEIDRFIY